MKRLLLVVLFATSAFGLDTTTRGNRIGVLLTRERYAGAESAMSTSIARYLREELTKAGFDAFDTKATYDDLSRNATTAADYYIEIAASESNGAVPGGIGIGNANVGVDISMVVAHVAAEVRLYDGRSLELIRRFDLSRVRKGISPTSISIGGTNLFAWIAVPISEVVQFRRAAHAVAKDAATQIAEFRQAD